LNKEKYQTICRLCDRVLLASGSKIERVAIPWLHVVREHPVFLKNYEGLFGASRGGRLRRGFRKFADKARWIRRLFRVLRSNGRHWAGSPDLPSHVDVLFVSHLLNARQADQEDDFYFGNIPNEMISKNYSVLIALLNHSGKPASTFSGHWKECKVPRVVLSESLGISEEIVLYNRLRKESAGLRNCARRESDGFFQKVLFRASQEALACRSQDTLCIFEQIVALVVEFKPDCVVVTHEGHAYERVAFAAARSVRPHVQCIGYQHAALFGLQHAIRRNLAREYNPDQILTAGAVGKGQLKNTPALGDIPISVLGSNRALKRKDEMPKRPDSSETESHANCSSCLVLPEGIASECHLLFEFSLECARACPAIQFIWRLHPILSFRSLLASNRKLRKIPGNIVLSESTLDEDIARCHWALYRGSTAVVQAVVAGVQPIYLDLSDELVIDPLYELDAWRKSIKSSQDFRCLVRDVRDGPRESESRAAKEYCERFYQPLNPDALVAVMGSRRDAQNKDHQCVVDMLPR